MLQRTRSGARKTTKGRRSGSGAGRIFGAMAEARSRSYQRPRDLPKLVALWPRELEDVSPEGILHVLTKLRRALRAERTRGLRGHWTYDLNRHIGLWSAYKGELALMRGARITSKRIAREAREALPPDT